MSSTTIQMDPVSANRFVSSLSKSLQALCHGCMDFDTQIEIVGFINLNIDCLGKVDYVLNEKVSKGSDNSMSFMSHSYLAKKDEPKTLKERSCSPIPELENTYQNQRSLSYQNTQHYRSSAIFSPHSQVVRGSQKRPRGNWRVTNRPSKSPRTQQYEPSYDNSQNFDESYSYTSTQSHPSTSYSHPSTSQQEYDQSNTSQPQVQLKTETPDETGDTYNQNLPSENNVNTPAITDINIKTDPDSLDPNTQQSSSHPNTQQQNNQSSAGYSESGQGTSESFFKTEYDASGSQNPDDTSNNMNETGGDGAQDEYDATEKQSYDASMYGEESQDASQFDDIIEIDDEEDEDLSQFPGADGQLGVDSLQPLTRKQGYHLDEVTGSYICEYCGNHLANRKSAKHHIKTVHDKRYKFNCNICGKGFPWKEFLTSHMSQHGMPLQYKCTMCHRKYSRKSSLKRHMLHMHLQE